MGSCSGPIFVYDYCWRSSVASALFQVAPSAIAPQLLPARGVGSWNLLYLHPFGANGVVRVSQLVGARYTFSYGFPQDSFGGADVVTVTDQQNGITYTYAGNYPVRRLVSYSVFNDTASTATVQTTIMCVDPFNSWPLVGSGLRPGRRH